MTTLQCRDPVDGLLARSAEVASGRRVKRHRQLSYSRALKSDTHSSYVATIVKQRNYCWGFEVHSLMHISRSDYWKCDIFLYSSVLFKTIGSSCSI